MLNYNTEVVNKVNEELRAQVRDFSTMNVQYADYSARLETTLSSFFLDLLENEDTFYTKRDIIKRFSNEIVEGIEFEDETKRVRMGILGRSAFEMLLNVLRNLKGISVVYDGPIVVGIANLEYFKELR